MNSRLSFLSSSSFFCRIAASARWVFIRSSNSRSCSLSLIFSTSNLSMASYLSSASPSFVSASLSRSAFAAFSSFFSKYWTMLSAVDPQRRFVLGSFSACFSPNVARVSSLCCKVSGRSALTLCWLGHGGGGTSIHSAWWQVQLGAGPSLNRNFHYQTWTETKRSEFMVTKRANIKEAFPWLHIHTILAYYKMVRHQYIK